MTVNVVRIEGRVVIRERKTGEVIQEIKNTVYANNIAEVLYDVFTNDLPPSSSTSPSIVVYEGTTQVPVPSVYNDFTWKGTLTVYQTTTINKLELYATFNGFSFPASQVTTSITLGQGDYTVEWIWDVDDPIGLVKDILDYGFANNYKGYSFTGGSCTNLVTSQLYNNTVTLFFACVQTATTTFSTYTLDFSVTNNESTTVSGTGSVDFSSKFKLAQANTLIVPLSIIIT